MLWVSQLSETFIDIGLNHIIIWIEHHVISISFSLLPVNNSVNASMHQIVGLRANRKLTICGLDCEWSFEFLKVDFISYLNFATINLYHLVYIVLYGSAFG